MSTFVDTMLEEVERALVIQLTRFLSDTLEEIEGEMTTDDDSFFGFIGIIPTPATPLVAPAIISQGEDPLAIERPLDDFPYIQIVSYVHPLSDEATTEVAIDQAETILSTAYIDALLNNDDREMLERQVKRYGKAIHRVIQKDFTLGGLCLREQVSPEVTESNTAVTPKSDTGDDITYFKGVRLQYTFKTMKSFYFASS